MVKRVMDYLGRMLRPATRAELLEEQAGPDPSVGRQSTRAHSPAGVTPSKLAGILRAAEMGDATAYLELAEEMEEKDLHYSAVLGVRKRAVRGLQIVVDPADDSAAAAEAADLSRTALTGPAIRESLIDVMDAIGKGYSVSEIIWDTAGKQWWIEGLEFRDPTWFRFDPQNGQHLLLRGAEAGQLLSPDKYLIHVSRAKSGLPIRGGLARLAAWAVMFKNFGVKDWAIFLETYGHPLRLGKYDPALANEADKRVLLRAVRQIGVDLAAIIPHNMAMEVISADSKTTDAYERQARWWDEQMSKGVLGQTATTDAIAGGHAVGKIHEAVREDIRDADVDQLAISLMRDIARPLTLHNLGPGVPPPTIRFQPPESVNPERLLKLMEVAGPAGLQIALADVYRAFNLRRPEQGDEVLNFARAVEPSPMRQLASRQPARDPITALIDDLVRDGRMARVVAVDLGPLVAALQGAGSLEEALDILDNAAPITANGDLRDLLAAAVFAARLGGSLGPV